MKKIFGIILALVVLLVNCFSYADNVSAFEDIVEVPARKEKLTEIIVIEDGTPRSSESGIIIKDGDYSNRIVSTERLNKAPTIIPIQTLSTVQANISVINGREDPAFGADDAYLYVQGCLRYFDSKGHYMPSLDGYDPDEASSSGAVYVTLARFHSSIEATEVAQVLFYGGAKVSIGYTVTVVTLKAVDGRDVQFEKRHYAILPEGKKSVPASPSKPTPTPSGKPTPTPVGPTPTPTPVGPTPTPTPVAPTPTPTPVAPTPTPTPTPAENTPNPQFSEIVDPPFDDETPGGSSNTPAPSFSDVSDPVFDDEDHTTSSSSSSSDSSSSSSSGSSSSSSSSSGSSSSGSSSSSSGNPNPGFSSVADDPFD